MLCTDDEECVYDNPDPLAFATQLASCWDILIHTQLFSPLFYVRIKTNGIK